MSPDLLVVGAGPSGLAAAIEARRLGLSVRVVDREPEAGGIPRHSDHLGYGIRDMHRVMNGPRYARRYVALAERASAELSTEASVTGWTGSRSVIVTSPRGIEEVQAGAIVLATGCRERPRAARLVPGGRPPGVLTTGSLQQLVTLQGWKLRGRRAVIVGAEHVSFSAVLTLAHAGARAAAMVTEHPHDQTYLWLKVATAGFHRVPIVTGSRVTGIVGRDRLEAVEVTDVSTGRARRIDCDVVVFTGDWIPDHELARLGGLAIDPGTRGPRVDARQRTSREGVFACGNVVHAAETADTAARCGREAARAAALYLRDGAWPGAPVPIEVEPPLAWVSPNAVTSRSDQPPHGRFLLRVDRFAHGVEIGAFQGERALWSGRYRRLVPARPIHAPVPWLTAVDPRGPSIRFRLS